LDCRTPTRVRSGLLTDVCGRAPKSDEGKEEDVVILQYSETRVLKAYRCKKKVSRINEICGAFSHSKILEPPDILKSVPFDSTVCQETLKRLTYTKETGQTMVIDVNRSYDYKYIEHGKLTISSNDVACEGANLVLPNGETHQSIVTLVTVNVEFKEVQVEEGLRTLMDLDSNVRLPQRCLGRDLCEDGMTAYVIHHPPSLCPLYNVRTVRMKKIEVNTARGLEPAFLSQQHKMLFLLKGEETVDNACKPLYRVSTTQYDNLKLLHNANVIQNTNLNRVVAKLDASALDLSLELMTSEEYLSYALEERIQGQVNNVGLSLCQMNTHHLDTAELSPFHENSLLRIRGEILQEYTCTPARIEIRIGDERAGKCYKDSLPGWYQNQPIFVQAATNLIVTAGELDQVHCNSQFSPIFVAETGELLIADPKVRKIELELSHLGSDYLHALTKSTNVIHDDWSSDFLYTSEEINQFNDLIHFQRAKSQVVDQLVKKYCSTADCGSYQPQADATFDLANLQDLEKNLEDQFLWYMDIPAKMEQMGSYCSLGITVALGLYIIYKLFCITQMTCRGQPLKKALRVNLFFSSQLARQYMREELEASVRMSDLLNREPLLPLPDLHKHVTDHTHLPTEPTASPRSNSPQH
jgi:hypothetical protein